MAIAAFVSVGLVSPSLLFAHAGESHDDQGVTTNSEALDSTGSGTVAALFH